MAGKRIPPKTDPRPDPTAWHPTWHPGPQGGPNKGGNGGGKNNGGGGGGGKPPRRNKGPGLQARALNDVQISFQPQLDAIRQAQMQAQQQYAKDQARVQSIYGGLLNQLGPLSGTYDNAAGGIAADLTSQIGGLAGLLGSSVEGVPASEIAAGTNAVGTQGAGALEMLATDRGHNLDYNTSAIRQGGIEQMTAGRNYLMDLQNLMDQYAQQGIDIRAQMPSLIMSRLAELRDQQWQRRMAKKEFGLRKATVKDQLNSSNALGRYVKKQVKGSRNNYGPGGGGGGAGTGGGGGGGGTGNPPRVNPAGDGSGGAALNHIISGVSSWNQLTPGQQAALRSSWSDASVALAVRQEWMRLFPNRPFTISGPDDLVQKLKEISQRHAGLAADPNGPGPGR